VLLGFKRRFEPFVLDHSKFHTIRAMGGRVWRAGMICDCYVDSRQKTMRLLGRFPCVKVQGIRITLFTSHWMEIWIDGVHLGQDEARAFAWRDGFRPEGSTEGDPKNSLDLMMQFWIDEHGINARPFRGDLIHWCPAAEVSEAARWRKARSA
jgi:hypothetical protein